LFGLSHDRQSVASFLCSIKQGTSCERHRKSVLLHKIEILEQNEYIYIYSVTSKTKKITCAFEKIAQTSYASCVLLLVANLICNLERSNGKWVAIEIEKIKIRNARTAVFININQEARFGIYVEFFAFVSSDFRHFNILIRGYFNEINLGCSVKKI